MSWGVQVPFLSENIIRCVPFLGHDYYKPQAGKGYPVFAGRRYQRGHGLGSIFGGLFKAAMPLLKKGAKTLGRTKEPVSSLISISTV
jgi:hypothetical protein